MASPNKPTIEQMLEELRRNAVGEPEPLDIYKAKGGAVDVRPTVKDETLQRKIPEMETAAKALQAGLIDHKEYDRIVNKHKPVKPYTFVPKPATDEDAKRALISTKQPHWRGAEKWPAGRKVGLRLDIPAYENHGVWVNSIHDEEGSGENKFNTSYGPVSSVKNATFDAGPSKGIRVATGEQNKSPFAKIKGELHHMSEDEAVEHMKKHLNHPDWAQVGMDPRRHGFFYDRKTMQPVTHSAHVVQIGPLVLAHKPTYGERDTYADGGKVQPSVAQMKLALTQKGGKGGFVNDAHREWFGDSKVVDENGKPRVMYHGSTKVTEDGMPFTEFAKTKQYGYHVGTAEQATNINIMNRGWGQSERTKPGAYMMPLYIRAENPLRVSDGEANDSIMLMRRLKDAGAITPEAYEKYRKEGNQTQNWEAALIATLERLGYDSLVYENTVEGKGDSYVLFKPTQIKSATGNNGQFDPTNPDITKAEGGKVQPSVAEMKLALTQKGGVLPKEEHDENLRKFLEKSHIKNRLYHATPENFSEFKPGGKDPTLSGPAIWLSPDPTQQPAAHNIWGGSRGFKEGTNVMPVHVQTKNPLILDDKTMIEWAREVFADGSREFPDLLAPKTVAEIKKEGYDSIIHADPYKTGRPHEVIMFEPNKIKSAIANRGTFDTSSPDITKAEGGKVQPSVAQMKLALNKQGMYSPLEKAALSIPRTKGTPAEFMAEISKQPGFRKEEVEDRKISLPEQKMTKDEFLGHLKNHPAPLISEKELGGEGYREDLDNIAKSILGDEYATYDDLDWRDQEVARHDVKTNWGYDPEPRHGDWQLPGGDNYREVLLKLPQRGLSDKQREIMMNYEANMRRGDQLDPWHQKQYEALAARKDADKQDFHAHHHWDDPNVLAHLRLSDRTGPSGEKILHIEEIQSDWHQAGRKKGYYTPEQRQELKDAMREWKSGREGALFNGPDQFAKEHPEYAWMNHAAPDAPFKKNWHELALKHALGIAAKGGYHGVAITPGDIQADRWDNPGLKVQYDKAIPTFLNKLGKPHGAQVGKIAVKTPSNQEPASGEDIAQNFGMSWDDFSNHPDRPALEKQFWQARKNKTTDLHYFPITDSLRQQIKTEGLPQYQRGGIIHKAEGGIVPTIEQMKASLGRVPGFAGLTQLQSVGAQEAPGLNIKAYIPPSGRPDNGVMPVGGVDTSRGNLPIGGIDMSRMQPGQQLMPMQQPQMAPQGASQQQGGMPQPQQAQQPQQPQGGSSILQLTPQGQAMAAMGGQRLAKGGSAKSIEDMKSELANPDQGKRVTIHAEGPGNVKGIVVPRHTLEGNAKSGAVGLHEMNEARAQVYGSDHRPPLTLAKMANMHKTALAEHFAKPVEEQVQAEKDALGRLRAAKHIGKTADTLDESEKLDTVRHEYDEQGRSHVGYAAKGVAGHALYTSGHGKDTKYHVINTCPGQTEGCGGGKDAEGIVDTKKGTCFAPNAESQYPGAATRRAAHAQAKHDPAMTNDWIIAHTGSMRNAANRADKSNHRLLFRPNVVDETDVSSRHVIRHLNEQRKSEGKPPIIANSYGKTNELHDPENGYYVTHSNIGPKVKHGKEITENIGRDRARIRNTILAADNKGDFTNEQGHKTPPKGSYMVTDVKRGSKLSKDMEGAITHAKYWSTGRSHDELSEEERNEGPEAHYSGTGRKTTEEKAHYGHKTVGGLRFDYQKQHILHPRLVQVGTNKDGTPHMIPTDSRFKDTEFLPKNRFKTKNGKEAGHILMTTPTESTSTLGHQTSFTHHVSHEHIKHAMENNGEYEIDKPEHQIAAKGKEYSAPQAINIPKTMKLADGGSVFSARHHGLNHDDFHAFPEQNFAAQRHLAMRLGDDEQAHSKRKLGGKAAVHKDLDTMRYELTMKAK